MECTRPVKIPYPNIWASFHARDVNSDEIVKYIITDLTEDRFDDAIEQMVDNYLTDEPTANSSGILLEEKSLQEYTKLFRDTFKLRMSIACYKEGSDELVAINLLNIKNRHNEHFKYFGDRQSAPKLARLMDSYEYYFGQFSICDKYNVDQYLGSFGLSVMRKYRRCGIATQMLNVRIPIMQAYGLRITSTQFSSIGSQNGAAKNGYHVDYEISYAKLIELGYDLPDIEKLSGVPSMKQMTLVLADEYK